VEELLIEAKAMHQAVVQKDHRRSFPSYFVEYGIAV
jgi:hypothetical protein